MRKLLTFYCLLLMTQMVVGQSNPARPKTQMMTLGSFHFNYPNLDVVKTDQKDQISVLEEPYQSDIIAICKAIEAFRPTKIAIEVDPSGQSKIDSLYQLYRAGDFTLGKDESYQLGFRIAGALDLNRVYCVNDWGRHYPHIEALFADSVRLSRLEKYFYSNGDSIYNDDASQPVTSIIDELIRLNNPEDIKERLSGYLMGMFKYEEQAGDFTGVDFQTGRWFSRNMRIFRNIQRLDQEPDDRILLIIGRDHLNVLNWFFEVSKAYELVSPLPYLQQAKAAKSTNP